MPKVVVSTSCLAIIKFSESKTNMGYLYNLHVRVASTAIINICKLLPAINWTVKKHTDAKMNHLVTKPTKWYVRPAKTPIMLGSRPV